MTIESYSETQRVLYPLCHSVPHPPSQFLMVPRCLNAETCGRSVEPSRSYSFIDFNVITRYLAQCMRNSTSVQLFNSETHNIGVEISSLADRHLF